MKQCRDGRPFLVGRCGYDGDGEVGEPCLHLPMHKDRPGQRCSSAPE